MITFHRFKDIRAAEEDYVVIPVTANGQLLPGLMTWWAENAPDDVMLYYTAACNRGDVYPGQIMTFNNSSFILAVTKARAFSVVSDDAIEDICENLNFENTLTKKTVAVPLFVPYIPWRRSVIKGIMTHHLQGARGYFHVYS